MMSRPESSPLRKSASRSASMASSPVYVRRPSPVATSDCQQFDLGVPSLERRVLPASPSSLQQQQQRLHNHFTSRGMLPLKFPFPGFSLSRPQRWSLSFLVAVTFFVATACSLFINSIAFAMIQQQQVQIFVPPPPSVSGKPPSSSSLTSLEDLHSPTPLESLIRSHGQVLLEPKGGEAWHTRLIASNTDGRVDSPFSRKQSLRLNLLQKVSDLFWTKLDWWKGEQPRRSSRWPNQLPRLVYLAPTFAHRPLFLTKHRYVRLSDVAWDDGEETYPNRFNRNDTSAGAEGPSGGGPAETTAAASDPNVTMGILKAANSSRSINNTDDDEADATFTNDNSKDNREEEQDVNSHCLPWADWQTAYYLNCNRFHEIDMATASAEVDKTKTARKLVDVREEELSVLGEGWFRTAWKFRDQFNTTVLKTLRLEREFEPEYYELHRRDAVAMERLTASEFVVNVFGFCGQSAINEIADFPYEGLQDLEHFDRRMRGKVHPKVDRIKLQIAASIAQGIADIHSIDQNTKFDLGGRRPTATMVHYDLNPRNIAMFKHGRPKINDFNIAEFLRYDPATNITCGFVNRMHQPWWRAPEEVVFQTNVLDEKVDVYALGNILFHILTTHAPHGKMKVERMESIREVVARGEAAIIPAPFNNTKNHIFAAFHRAMDLCFIKDATQRATSQQIVDILLDALVQTMNADGLARVD